MSRKQWRFLVMVLVICAARAFAQQVGEATVGWDPMECWDCSTMGVEGLYAVMIGGPICGIVIGVLRALGQSRENTEPVLNLVRFS